MVCFDVDKPLPQIPNYFSRGSINRLLVNDFYKGLEENVEDNEPNARKINSERPAGNLREYVIDSIIGISLISMGVSAMYGVCRLLEYFGVLEKLD